MKRKTVKRLAYFLAFIMIFSNVTNTSAVTVFAEGSAAGTVSEESERSLEENVPEEPEGSLGETGDEETEESTVAAGDGETEESTVAAGDGETEESTAAARNEESKESTAETGKEETKDSDEETVAEEMTVETEVETVNEGAPPVSSEKAAGTEEVGAVDGEYTLKFIDEFEGEALNTNYWNYETHEPGRTNNELQEYTDSEENIFLSDGVLVIQANKEERDGEDYYTSGKVTTQNKFDFKYGKIEARIKVPEAKGLLPAFWMMPTNEKLYGAWPKCGEIDIMEVLGDETDTVYGTVHYGNPHEQNHASYTLEQGTFDSAYHIFSAVWEPGLIEFYVDGIKYSEVTDWYTKEEGMEAVTFPAPFDQNFYLQLNLAVGGDWPGDPDETFSAEGEQLWVDWVKVWQKDSYDENVEKPEVVFREPDAEGNYVINGDFSVEEALNDSEDWIFFTAKEGKAEAAIADGVLTINTAENGAGTELYSVQLVQPQLPMKKGNVYKLTFEARADKERTMVVDVSAPDNSWIRYLEDTTAELGTEWGTYEYSFTMTSADDVNGRLEFNLGNQGSTAQVQFKNVKLVVSDTEEVTEEKGILSDGNYVYNGGFEIGTDRLGYWKVTNTAKEAEISVTNDNGERWLKVSGTKVGSLGQIVVKQDGLALIPVCEYRLSFDAYADTDKTVRVKAAGKAFDVNLTTQIQQYEYLFTTPLNLTNAAVEFDLGTIGTVYIDNVAVKENAKIINGKFDNGLTGWTHYAYTAISKCVSVEVVKEEDNNVLKYTIGNTGSVDWYIQFKQDNICLEKGKKYKLSFKAKSDVNRKLQFTLQQGNADDSNRIAYSGKDTVELTGEYQEFSKIFTMRYETDDAARLRLSLGAVDGTQIEEEHYIWLDDFELVEVETEGTSDEKTAEMIMNGNFEEGNTNWSTVIGGTANATVAFENNTAVFNIVNAGSKNWNIQLSQSGLNFELDKEYVVKLTAEAENTRYIEFGCLGNADKNYQWYSGGKAKLEAGKEKEITYTFKMGAADGVTESDSNAVFAISLGKVTSNENLETDTGKVTIKSVSIMPKDTQTAQTEGLWVEEISYMTYTGKAITPVVTVHDGDILLEQDRDYKVTYKRNKTVGSATVTVNGIGNYSGKDTTKFSIHPKDISDDDVVVDYKEKLVENGKNQNPLTKITYNGIRLGNKDYKVEYYRYVDGVIPEDAVPLKQLKTIGDYQMRITGSFDKATWTGNYTGTITKDIKVYAKSSATDISKMTVKIGGKKSGYSVVCDGMEQTPSVEVLASGKVIDSANYTVEYKHNTAVGTASVIITGAEEKGYVGTVTRNFKITATKLSTVAEIDKEKWKASVDFDETTGAAVQAEDMLKLKAGKTDDFFGEGTAYTVSYSKNTQAGTATVVYRGTGKYTGTIKKTFKVNAITLFQNDETPASELVETRIGTTAEFAQKGSSVSVVVKYNGTLLTEGVDYKVTYKNNKAVTTEEMADKKKPQVIITGINGYKGKTTATFAITPANLEDMPMTVADVTYQNKKGKYMSIPVLTDADGKNLKVNKDFTVKYYLVSDGSELTKKDVVDAKQEVKAVVTTKSANYSGSSEADYKIVVQNISDAKVVVKPQVYTGAEITLTEEDFSTMKVGKTTLLEGTDYEIIEDSYRNNINKGTASVTLKGIGNYGGTKKVTFKISSRTMAWWWNLMQN